MTVAVVGSGPGGAVTACHLAEGGRDTLLIEEGHEFSPGELAPFSAVELRRAYRNSGITVALGDPSISYVEGRCWGGGSEVNAALYRRPDPEALEHWSSRFKVQGLSERELLPHFEACETELGVCVSDEKAPPDSKLARGAKALGLTTSQAPRMARRVSRVHLARFLRAGGRRLTGARVERVLRAGRRWSLGPGLEADAVFLCCGAVGTPALLRRSGLRRNIGDTLLLHPMAKALAVFEEPVNLRGMGIPAQQAQGQGWTFGCSVSSPPFLALHMTEHRSDLAAVLERWEHAAMFYVMVPGCGSGSVRPLPFFRDPLVRYQVSQEELFKLGLGRTQLTALLEAAGAVKVFPSAATLSATHLFSSCPMGEDPRLCAVDSFGRVHREQGLYVSDASILPSCPGVNPQGTVMALARRNALAFLGKL